METGTRIIDVTEDYVVLCKESGLDTVPLKKERGKPSLLSFASDYYPECLSVGGDNFWEGGVLHRLDRPTSGLVLIARKQSFYDKMIEEQEEGRFLKYYIADTERTEPLSGAPPFPFTLHPGLVIHSKFRKYGQKGKSVRPLVPSDYLYSKEKREYETFVENIDGSTFNLRLYRGFRHQIRSHLAWSGNAIKGDTLYGAKPNSVFGLTSYAIEFLGERISLI